MIYKIRYISKEGIEIDTYIDAINRKEALKIAIYEAEKNDISVSSISIDLKKNIFNKKYKIKDSELSEFCRYMYILISSNLQIDKSISLIKNRFHNKYIKGEFDSIERNILDGYSIIDSIKMSRIEFPKMFLEIMEVGDLTGNIEISLNYLANYFSETNKFKKELYSSLMYPIILLFVVIVSFIVIMRYVIPDFIELFYKSGIQAPTLTQIVFNFSKFIQNHFKLIILLIISIIYIFKKLYSHNKINYIVNKFLIKIPILRNIIININSVQFSKSLYIMFSSGLGFQNSINLSLHNTKNLYYKESYKNMISKIDRGYSLYDSIKNKENFPLIMKTMILVGEESGELEKCLKISSDIITEDLSSSLKRFLKILEPLLIVFISLMVIGIILTVFIPILNVYSILE